MSWKVVKLKDVLKQYRIEHRVQDDINYKQVTISKHDGVKFRGYKLGKNIGRKRQFIVDLKKHPKTLMFVRQGVYEGAIGIAPKEVDGCIATENMPMFDIVNIDVNYLSLIIKSPLFKEKLSKIQTSGSAQKSIHERVLLEVEIPYPSIEEQKEIVRLLNERNTNINSISTELTHQLDLVKKLRQAFLREAMQGKLTTDWRKQNPNVEPATELLAKIKAEKEQLIKEKKLKRGKASSQSVSLVDKIEVPKTWIWAKTDEIFFVTKLAGFEYSKHISLKPSGEIPVIRAQNVRPFEISKKNLLYIDRKTSELLDRCSLTKEALLVTFIGAGIGDVARFYEKERWHLAPNVAKLEPFEGCESMMNLKFINYFLMSDNGRAEIFKHVKATAQPSLSMGTIRDIDIPLPPLSEQKAIVDKLDELMAYCDSLEESIKNSQKQNEMLLQQVLQEALEPKEITVKEEV